MKRFDDSQIYEKNGAIEVIDQLNRYKSQIANQRNNIIKAYNNAMYVFYNLFKTEKFEVKDVCPQVWLFVTGCPKVVYDGKTKEAVEKIERKGYNVYYADKASGTALVDMCKKSN